MTESTFRKGDPVRVVPAYSLEKDETESGLMFAFFADGPMPYYEDLDDFLSKLQNSEYLDYIHTFMVDRDSVFKGVVVDTLGKFKQEHKKNFANINIDIQDGGKEEDMYLVLTEDRILFVSDAMLEHKGD